MMNIINLAAFTAILFLSISFADSMTEVMNTAEENATVTVSSYESVNNNSEVPYECLDESNHEYFPINNFYLIQNPFFTTNNTKYLFWKHSSESIVFKNMSKRNLYG